MTDEQKLACLLTELKILARETHCYDNKGGGDYYYPENSLDCFEDGSKYALVSFARAILESMDESYDDWDAPIPDGVDPWNLRGRS
jgi:hypothetical protein